MKRIVSVIVLAALMLPMHTIASVIDKMNNGDALNLGPSWVGGVAPGLNDIAQWSATIPSGITNSLGANTSWSGLKLTNPSGSVAINAGNTLTIGASGIDMTLATANLNLNCATALGASQAWNITNNQTLAVMGAISGSSVTLNLAGSGTALLSGANTFSGTVAVNAGSLLLSNQLAMGHATGIVANGAQICASTAGSFTNALTLTGIGNQSTGYQGALLFTPNNGALNWTGPITLANGARIGAYSVMGSFTLSGGIGGTGDLEFWAGGASSSHYHNFTISVPCNYTGNTFMNTFAASPVVILAAGANTLPTNTTLNMLAGIFNGSPLNATLELNGNNQTLAGLASGAGAFGGGGTNRIVNGSATAATLTINCAADSYFDGLLGGPGANQNNFGLIKNGTGVLTINRNCTHTGSTIVNAGTLALNGLVSGTSGLLMGSNATLQVALGVLGGATNIVVNGNVTLAGQINVSDFGIMSYTNYPVIYYTGTLVNNGMTVASNPPCVLTIDTSVPHLIRLVIGQKYPPSAVYAQNLIQNGDFTANATSFTNWPGHLGNGNPATITNWISTQGNNVGVNGAGVNFTTNKTFWSISDQPFGPSIINGCYTFAFIQNIGGLTQNLTLMPNTTYQLGFNASAQAFGNPQFLAQISDNSQVYVSSGSINASNTVFIHYAYTFTTPAAISGIPSIQLYNLSTNGSTVDFSDVELTAGMNPAIGTIVSMDQSTPLAISWLQSPNATAYDVYLGTLSNSVANATTNTTGIYQGRTSTVTMNTSGILPNTTYYWRLDIVDATGTPTKGIVYSFSTGGAMVDLMEDTWVATDALNRSLPGITECGMPRTNRLIGILYEMCLNTFYPFGVGTNWNITEYLASHPYSNPHDPWADNPPMQVSTNGSAWYWAQPELGYYDPADPWVLRREIAMLNNAGIDVLVFDLSNAWVYDAQLYALCDMIEEMRREGCNIKFKIVFLTHTLSGFTATYIYNTFYAADKYPDLWFYWQGKPLMLGEMQGSGTGDVVPSVTVQSFFTWRPSWDFNSSQPLQDQWQFTEDKTPQNWSYDARYDLAEEMPVSSGHGCIAHQKGRSSSNNLQQDYDKYQLPVQHTSGLGIQYKEEMNYGLKYDPEFLWLEEWNLWAENPWFTNASCWTIFLNDCLPASGFYFVDTYNEEYSSGDMEPMKGGHTDNYYFQMVSQNRLRKGVRPIPPASAPQTINLTNGFTQWNTVGPAYYDPANDAIWRNYPSAEPALMGIYTNTSGRNDLTVMKVARDANNFYFFAQCNSNLTSYTGSNWMVLFIDADQNHLTGWEGYDYAVNLGGVGPSTTTLYQNTTTTNGWTWTPVRSDIAYTVSGNQMMLRQCQKITLTTCLRDK